MTHRRNIKKKEKDKSTHHKDEIARKIKKEKRRRPTHKDDNSADDGGVVGRDLEIDALVLRVHLPLTSNVCNGYLV